LLDATQLGATGVRVQWGLSQQAGASTGAFLNGRCTSTAGFHTLQVKPHGLSAFKSETALLEKVSQSALLSFHVLLVTDGTAMSDWIIIGK